MDTLTELKRETLARHLRKYIQGEIRFGASSRRLSSTEASIYQIEPLGVVIPRTVEDLVTVVQVAGEMHIPLTARGGGTRLSGQSIGSGVVVDCSKYLNALIQLDPAACVARVQPGVAPTVRKRAAAPGDEKSSCKAQLSRRFSAHRERRPHRLTSRRRPLPAAPRSAPPAPGR